MNKTVIVALLGLFVVPFAPNAAACNGVITEIIVEDGSPAGQGIYIDDRDTLNLEQWIYAENNGVDGLQSGGPGPVLPGHFDTCATYGGAGPDLLLY